MTNKATEDKASTDLAGQVDPLVRPANPMIAEALERGEDATGLCTIRELASYLIKNEERRQAEEGLSDIWETPLKCEMFFLLPDGYSVNVEVHVTCIKKA